MPLSSKTAFYTTRLRPGVTNWMYRVTRRGRQQNMEEAVRTDVESLPSSLRNDPAYRVRMNDRRLGRRELRPHPPRTPTGPSIPSNAVAARMYLGRTPGRYCGRWPSSFPAPSGPSAVGSGVVRHSRVQNRAEGATLRPGSRVRDPLEDDSFRPASGAVLVIGLATSQCGDVCSVAADDTPVAIIELDRRHERFGLPGAG